MVAGRHKDDTVKYAVNEAGSSAIVITGGAQALINSHKTAGKAKEEHFNKFWDDKTPTW